MLPINRVKKQEPDFRLAISLVDLDRIDPIVRAKMLCNRLDLDNPVKTGGKSADIAIPFTCRLTDAATIVDILRSEDRKAGDSPTRVYLHNGKSWQKMASDRSFTVIVKGKIQLNPQVFNITIEHEPPPISRVRFGE